VAIKLISDPHGRFEGLRGAVDPSDILLVLGDILDLVDWSDVSGILPEVLGREEFISRVREAVARGTEAAVALRDELMSPEGSKFPLLQERVWEQYCRFADVLEGIGCRSYVIYGNGDLPALLEKALEGREGIVLADGRVEIDGLLFGFIPGAIHSPFRMPAEMGEEEYNRKLEGLGRVDVLCTHVPPQAEEFVHDVVAGRPVVGSSGILAYLERHAPLYHYHGHVHQPRRRGGLLGRTKVINVGYFKRQGYVHVHGNDGI
jgi:Icc-related predicted phosphoesterase